MSDHDIGEPLVSLQLCGDGDELDLIRDVESAFGVQFSTDDLAACRTAGDFHELVVQRLPEIGTSRGGCATALCFFRLRAALQQLAPDKPLKPSTPMTVFADIRAVELCRLIKKKTGLRTPALLVSETAALTFLATIFAAPIGASSGLLSWWSAFALIALPALALTLVPARLPKEITTFGELVELVAIMNIGAFARLGARLGEREAWEAMATILSSHATVSGVANVHKHIALDTLLLAPQPK